MNDRNTGARYLDAIPDPAFRERYRIAIESEHCPKRALVCALNGGADAQRKVAERLSENPESSELWNEARAGVPIAVVVAAQAVEADAGRNIAASNNAEIDSQPRFFGMTRIGMNSLLDIHLPTAPRVELVTDAILAQEGEALLSSALAVRLWYLVARKAYQQRTDSDADWRRVTFASWTEVRDAIGSRKGQHVYDLRRIAHAMAARRVELPKPLGTGQIFALDDGHRVAFYALTGMLAGVIYDPAVKQFSKENRGRQEGEGNSRLTPFPEVEPPLFGDRAQHAALLRLGFAVCVHLSASEPARDIYSGRGALIRERTWRDMAKRTGVSARALKRALDRWCREPTDEERSKGDTAPAFLRRVGSDRFEHAHPLTHQLIVHGGQHSDGRARLARAKHTETREGKPPRRKRSPRAR